MECCHYFHYFIAVDRTETMEGFSIAHFTGGASSGIGGLAEVKMEHYTWESSGFDILLGKSCKSSCISSCKCCKKIEEFELKKNEIHDTDIGPILLRLSDVIGDRHFDPVRYNCEHVANYVMSGKLESNQSNSCKARCCSVFIKNMKGLVLIAMAMICFCSAASGTIVRRAYEKLLLGLFMASKTNSSIYADCTDFFGENVISAADSLLLTQKIDDEQYIGISGDVNVIIKGLINELKNPNICDAASRLGKKVLLKTSLYTGVTFIALQAIYILYRTYYHLVPIRMSYAARNLKFPFFKEIVNDIVGGISSLVFMVGFGVIVQLRSHSPAFLYFFVAGLSGIVGRLSILLILECCRKEPCCTKDSKPHTTEESQTETVSNCCGGDKNCTCICLLCPAIVLTVLLGVTVIVFLSFYSIPCCWDPI